MENAYVGLVFRSANMDKTYPSRRDAQWVNMPWFGSTRSFMMLADVVPSGREEAPPERGESFVLSRDKRRYALLVLHGAIVAHGTHE